MNKYKTIEEINEEFYGLEYEKEYDDEIESTEHPFDADEIRIDQQMLSLKYMYDLIQENQIDLSPNFQRNKVWNERKRKSLLIESLILRIPIPTFYFYENKESKFVVIDGKQRLTTIHDFLNDKFRLSGLEYLDETCGGKKFSELEVKYQQRIYRTQFAVNILDARSPLNVIFDIFRRVNTGGVSLRPQEIRNAIAKQETRNFLKEMVNTIEFYQATRGRIKDDRMDAQELVLRFFAFCDLYEKQFGNVDFIYGNLANYLDSFMIKLNNFDDYKFKEYELKFKESMRKSYEVFGEYSFRKIYIDELKGIKSDLDIINKSLFISWSVALSDNKYKDINFKNYSYDIKYKTAEMLEVDHNYNRVLTQGTGSRKSINYSFKVVNNILNEVLFND